MTKARIVAHIGAFKFYLLMLLLLGGAAFLGFKGGNFAFEQQNQHIAQLNNSIGNLKSENDELTKRLNILGVELEIARLANQETHDAIQEGLDNQVALKRELSFYQKVMAPELEEDGFTIDSLNIEATGSVNYYRFSLVLMQQDKRRSMVKGAVDMQLIGSLEGKPVSLDLRQLLTQEQRLNFSFRYFEVLKGTFVLPEGFVPEQVLVASQLADAKWGKGKLDRTFSWRDAAQGNT